MNEFGSIDAPDPFQYRATWGVPVDSAHGFDLLIARQLIWLPHARPSVRQLLYTDDEQPICPACQRVVTPGSPAIAGAGLLADRQLQEVLFNLVRNAGQAIAPPGTITIRARLHEGNVRVEIEDTGSGIPPDKLGKIYDPFFTTKEPGKGTGLGLFIVRQIVERNKGRISVESAVGKGTTFFLDFPAAKPIVVPVPA